MNAPDCGKVYMMSVCLDLSRDSEQKQYQFVVNWWTNIITAFIRICSERIICDYLNNALVFSYTPTIHPTQLKYAGCFLSESLT